jgi:hypothetical protein
MVLLVSTVSAWRDWPSAESQLRAKSEKRIYSEGPTIVPRLSEKDFEQHLVELRTRLPTTDQFHICLAEPFVVIGNETPEIVEQRAEQTVRWAVERLKRQYFPSDPQAIIDIWLFKDKETYERYNQELFGAAPHTPFGYYASRHKALVMNIATGGGTLVHEIVHPFIEANFAECPSWFNEGLASLYEQCADRDGKIWGATNWRLKGLQQAISDRQLPTFEQLCSTTTSEFYDNDRGNNYAQARYLCYYLQEHKLLEEYYQQFLKNRADDPTGYNTLVQVLDTPDMAEFQSDWEKYVLRLRFP